MTPDKINLTVYNQNFAVTEINKNKSTVTYHLGHYSQLKHCWYMVTVQCPKQCYQLSEISLHPKGRVHVCRLL